MLHIAITLLATALLAVSTGSNAVKNYETHEEQNTALRTEPKRAYYDPTGTYGTTAGQIYNYTGQTLNIGFYTYESDSGMAFQIENNQSHSAKLMNFSGNVAIPDGTYNYTQFTTADNTKEFDIYADGVYKKTLTLNTQTYTPCYLLNVGISEAENTNHYFWLFEQGQAPDPIEEMNENIFEAVGDTITGLSDALASPWEGILNIFYDTSENEVTQMGYLVFIGLGVSITLLVFWTILRLFKQRN